MLTPDLQKQKFLKCSSKQKEYIIAVLNITKLPLTESMGSAAAAVGCGGFCAGDSGAPQLT